MGFSPPSYPGLERRISNAGRSCLILVFVFVRLDSVCSHTRSAVTAWSREVFPAVGTSSWFHQRASSLSAHRHFWSLNPSLLFTQLPPQCGFQQVWEEMSSDPAAAACGCAGLLPGSCGCTGSASPGAGSVSASAACLVSHPHCRLEFACPGMQPDPLFLD